MRTTHCHEDLQSMDSSTSILPSFIPSGWNSRASITVNLLQIHSFSRVVSPSQSLGEKKKKSSHWSNSHLASPCPRLYSWELLNKITQKVMQPQSRVQNHFSVASIELFPLSLCLSLPLSLSASLFFTFSSLSLSLISLMHLWHLEKYACFVLMTSFVTLFWELLSMAPLPGKTGSHLFLSPQALQLLVSAVPITEYFTETILRQHLILLFPSSIPCFSLLVKIRGSVFFLANEESTHLSLPRTFLEWPAPPLPWILIHSCYWLFLFTQARSSIYH